MDYEATFEYYKKYFPSDSLLESLVGKQSDYRKQVVAEHQVVLDREGPARLYTDVSLADAVERGELTPKSLKGKWGESFYEIDEERFFAQNNIFAIVRNQIDSAVRVSARQRMRLQKGNTQLRRVFIFRRGAFGAGVRKENMPSDPEMVRQLAKEFIELTQQYPLKPDSWWHYRYDGEGTAFLEALPNAYAILQREAANRERNIAGFTCATVTKLKV